MIDYAVVLLNGKAYKSSNFGGISAIQFTKDGKVYGFTYKQVKYYAIFKFSTKYFLDYAEEDKFNALIVREKARKLGHYTGVDVGLWKNEKVPSLDITFKSYNELEEAAYNSDIYGVLRDRSGRCFNWFTWKYLNPYSGPIDPELAPGFTDLKAFLCDKFESNPAALKFYEDFKDQKFYDLATGKAETDARLIGEIAALMMKVDEQMTIAFNKFASAQANAGEFKFFKNTDGNYIKEQLVNYKNGFERWIQIYYEYQDKLKDLDDISQYYIIYDLYGKYNMLGKVDVPHKIKILKHFCDAGLGSLSDWYFGSWKEGLQHHESLVVEIVKSVTKEQAEEFLEGLISTKVQHRLLKNLGVQTRVTLYKRLFYLIDDTLGRKNFTAFVEALQDIVLMKNGIDPKKEREEIRSIPELQRMANTQFFFGTYKEKNRIDHYVVSTTDRTIEFKEEYWLETKLETRALSSGTGHVVRLYDEVGLKKMTGLSKVLGHFDLVSVHFFKEPSFVDRTTDPTYVGRHFLTFAGFVDYLKEKENTQDLIDLMNTTLFVISLAFGFGELLIAVRSALMLRSVVGAAMIAGDTSVFLTANIPFRNYLKDRYPNDHDDILGAMVIGGTLASLGASSIANSRILNAYSKKEAVEFLETAEFFLKETAAVSKFTPNEIERLKVGLERFENTMHPIMNEPGVLTIARRTKGKLKFHDSPAVRSELMLIEEAKYLQFVDDFAYAEQTFVNVLKKNPNYVRKWASYTAEEQILAKANPLKYLQEGIVSLRHTQKYFRPKGLFPKVFPDLILSKYGKWGLVLVDEVEQKSMELITTLSRTFRDQTHQLVAGMIDRSTGKFKLCTNFPRKVLERGGHLPEIEAYHPNLTLRIKQTREVREGVGYNMNVAEDIEFTGIHMAAHAEVRALNELAIERFGRDLIEPHVFDDWLRNDVLGYNRNIVTNNDINVIMPTCADCFYLTDLVTFIK